MSTHLQSGHLRLQLNNGRTVLRCFRTSHGRLRLQHPERLVVGEQGILRALQAAPGLLCSALVGSALAQAFRGLLQLLCLRSQVWLDIKPLAYHIA